MLDAKTIYEDLCEELGREPTLKEVADEYASRVDCLEQLADQQLSWNGDE